MISVNGGPAVSDSLPRPLQIIRYPEWQPEYHAAATEKDPDKLKERLAAAEAALLRRWQVIGPDPSVEREAMDEASRGLKVLLVEVLKYPGCEKESLSLLTDTSE